MLFSLSFRNNSIDFKDWQNCSGLYNYSADVMCSYTFSHSPFLPNDQGPESVILHIVNPDEKDEILRKLNCPKPPDIIGIVMGIIGAIVGVGKFLVFCLCNCSKSKHKNNLT